VTSGSGHKDFTKPQHGTANAGQHSGYSNSSIHTLYTAEILQPANGCRKEEARATTLCTAWPPSRRPQAAPSFPLTPAGEDTQPQPPALPLEAWPCKCNINKAKQPKRDKVFLNTTHS